jgi:uncharacterized protein YkwD
LRPRTNALIRTYRVAPESPIVRRLGTRPIPTILAALLLAGSLIPAIAAPAAAATGSSELVAAANGERSKASLRAVQAHATLNAIAAERAGHLVAIKGLSHDMAYVKERLAEEKVCWSKLGEILAWDYAPEAHRFISQWMGSDGHRKVMLGSDYVVAGGAWVKGTTKDGHDAWYAVMLFLKPCDGSALPSSTGASFTDIATSPFRGDIEWLVSQGITSGCSATRFCPSSPVTRAQMAVFLVRALNLPPTTRDYFRDDNGTAYQGAINALAASGITGGCAAGRFCPDGKVTRAAMASFLSRAYELGWTTRDYFWDDRGTMHESNINRVAQAQITGGCTSGRYCPDSAVTRGQMAAFLRRADALTR